MAGNVLVTGACGFIGRNVARECGRAGCIVIGMGHGTWAQNEWQKWGINEWYAVDVTFDNLLSYGGEPDLIIHCAGSGSVGISMSHPMQDFDRTVMTTRDVLEYVRLYRPEARVVLPSSASVYGNVKARPIAEDTLLCPVSPYGVHKKMAEELSLSYVRHFGISVAIVRLFSVYGTGLRKQLLWDTCSKLSSGSAVFGGTGQETRDWLHVDDAARLLLMAGNKATSGCQIVNGATGVGTPTRSIIESIANYFGGAGDVQFSGTSRPGDPLHLIADTSKARALGWKPNQVLDKELEQYVQWYKTVAF